MEPLCNLGTNIAKYRKAVGIKQEQLAEQLNVSVSAVSQWETGKTLPDISVIPILCYALGVTADELMDIDHEKAEAQIREIRETAEKLRDDGRLAKAEKMLQDALKRFPNRCELLEPLMEAYLRRIHLDEDNPSEKEMQNLHKLTSCAQKLLECSRDETQKNAARAALCIGLALSGDHAKADAIALQMPSLPQCRESLLALMTKGHAKLECLKTYNFLLLLSFCNNLDRQAAVRLTDGTPAYAPADEVALMQKSIDLLHLLFEDQDFGIFHGHLMRAHLRIARLQTAQPKARKTALEHLAAAADHAEAFLLPTENKLQTSLFLRGQSLGAYGTSQENNATAELLEALQDNEFDGLRKTKEFKEIVKRLEKTAEKRS